MKAIPISRHLLTFHTMLAMSGPVVFWPIPRPLPHESLAGTYPGARCLRKLTQARQEEKAAMGRGRMVE